MITMSDVVLNFIVKIFVMNNLDRKIEQAIIGVRVSESRKRKERYYKGKKNSVYDIMCSMIFYDTYKEYEFA